MAKKEKTQRENFAIHCKYDELKNPKSLKNHPKNRNKHGQDQIERLSEFYSFHGIRHPIIVSNLSGFIVAGHGRKLAAIRAGVKEYPIVYQDFDSIEAEYSFLQADNAIALWAELDLAGINSDIGDLGPDFNIDLLGIKDFTLDFAEKELETQDMEDVEENFNFTIKCNSFDDFESVRQHFGADGNKVNFATIKGMFK